MKDKNSIVDKIISDAKARADGIIGEARSKADIIIDKARQEAAEYNVESEKKLESRRAEIIERKISVDKLDGKNIVSDNKYSLVDKTYDLALIRLKSMKSAEYKEMIKSILIAVAENNDIVVIAESDAKRINSTFIKGVADSMSIKLSLSDKYGDFDGGIYLIGGGYDKNYSFGAMIDRLKEELNPIIAKSLFEVM